jgi:hypothetical protein
VHSLAPNGENPVGNYDRSVVSVPDAEKRGVLREMPKEFVRYDACQAATEWRETISVAALIELRDSLDTMLSRSGPKRDIS